MFGRNSCLLHVITEFLRRPLAGWGTPCVCGLLLPTQEPSQVMLLGAKCPLSAGWVRALCCLFMPALWGSCQGALCVWDMISSVPTEPVLGCACASLLAVLGKEVTQPPPCSDTTPRPGHHCRPAGAWQGWGHLGPATHTWAPRGSVGGGNTGDLTPDK